jgi:hypothetical protein
MKVNDFKTDLQYSLDQRECDMFDTFYKRAFPGLIDIELVEDMERQRKGIDKVLHFGSGYAVTIDEKKRRTDYGDILLELWSKYEDKKRGWLYYSQCDYIVYAVMPSKTAYLLPVFLLKKAWQTNKGQWLQNYKTKASRNDGYTTMNIPIPTDVLMDGIMAEMQQEMVVSN